MQQPPRARIGVVHGQVRVQKIEKLSVVLDRVELRDRVDADAPWRRRWVVAGIGVVFLVFAAVFLGLAFSERNSAQARNA
jgi:hypothetical protein